MELKEKLVSSFMAFEEQIDVHSELHDVRTTAIKNFENKGLEIHIIEYHSKK
jgi:Fe-S cluster assembly protein SufD